MVWDERKQTVVSAWGSYGTSFECILLLSLVVIPSETPGGGAATHHDGWMNHFLVQQSDLLKNPLMMHSWSKWITINIQSWTWNLNMCFYLEGGTRTQLESQKIHGASDGALQQVATRGQYRRMNPCEEEASTPPRWEESNQEVKGETMSSTVKQWT